MRGPAVAAGVVLLLAGAAFAGAELLRSRLETSVALRESVEAAASAQLGAELRAGGLDVAFWPARLGLRDAELTLPGGARLALSGVEVRLGPRELLGGLARAESASVTGPARLVAKRVSVAGVVDLRLEPEAGSGGWRVRGEARLDAGGRVRVDGRLGAGGRFAGELRAEGVEARPFAALLASDGVAEPELSGRFDGRIEPAREAHPATLRFESADARVRVPPVLLEGPVALVARLPDRAAGAPATRFAIDASRARVEYAGTRLQASGDGASVEGRLAWDEGGRLRVEGVALRVTGFRGQERR